MLAFVAISAGCGSTRVAIQDVHLRSPGPFERLTVFVSLPKGGDNASIPIYRGFRRVLRSKLEACDVSTFIVAGMPGKLDGSVGPQHPPIVTDARLIVRARYGSITTVVDQHGRPVFGENNKLDIDFWFELSEQKSTRVTWLAFANLKSDDWGELAGEDLADAIVGRLRLDGVLKRCR
ncbi:MAG: hypothetical protein AB7O24_23765 [Kofleriaceae bacterium]